MRTVAESTLVSSACIYYFVELWQPPLGFVRYLCKIDDGDLTTGAFKDAANGRYTYTIE